MNKKLHIVGELMNNSYARARKAFTARDPDGLSGNWQNCSPIWARII